VRAREAGPVLFVTRRDTVASTPAGGDGDPIAKTLDSKKDFRHGFILMPVLNCRRLTRRHLFDPIDNRESEPRVPGDSRGVVIGMQMTHACV